MCLYITYKTLYQGDKFTFIIHVYKKHEKLKVPIICLCRGYLLVIVKHPNKPYRLHAMHCQGNRHWLSLLAITAAAGRVSIISSGVHFPGVL